MAKKFMKKLKEEVGEKGRKLSVTENGKERGRWLLRVASWMTSCVNAARKEE